MLSLTDAQRNEIEVVSQSLSMFSMNKAAFPRLTLSATEFPRLFIQNLLRTKKAGLESLRFMTSHINKGMKKNEDLDLSANRISVAQQLRSMRIA